MENYGTNSVKSKDEDNDSLSKKKTNTHYNNFYANQNLTQQQFSKTNSKFGLNFQNFKSHSSSKKDEFMIFNKLTKKDYSVYDTERYRETILNLKKDINKKNNEINALKIEISQLTIEDKKKIKAIEKILSSTGKTYEDIIQSIEENKQLGQLDLANNSVIKLREIYVIHFLKSQVHQLKTVIKEKDVEIKDLKDSTKVTKIIQLDNEISSYHNENTQLKEKCENLFLTNKQLKESYDNLKTENDLLYAKYLKKIREIERLVSNMSKLEEDNRNFLKDKKKADEECNKYKLNMINMKSDLKFKTDFYNSSKDVDEKVHQLEKENENLVKKVNNLTKEKLKLNMTIK